MTDQQPTRAQRREATAARILEAAQEEFGTHGDGATIRGIARRAGVDPSLVLQHYGSKQALFALAVRPVDDLDHDDVPRHLEEVLDVRLHELPAPTRALLRSMLTSPQAAEVMSTYLQERAATLAATMDDEQAATRAALVVSSIMGVTIARHFLDLPGLSDASGSDVAELVERWLDPGPHRPTGEG